MLFIIHSSHPFKGGVSAVNQNSSGMKLSDPPVSTSDSIEIEYLYRIRNYYPSLSKKQKKVAKYISGHQNEVLHSSISQLAAKIGVNPPTITRFSQAIGFKGFSELKFYMEKGILSPFSEKATINKEDSLSVIKQKITDQDSEVIEDTISLLEEDKIEHIISVLNKSERLVIFAEGGSTAAAVAAHNMFAQLGIHCESYQDAFLGITVATQLNKKSVAIAISYSGSSINSVNFLKECRSKGAYTVAITGYKNSPLTQFANTVLYTSTKVANNLYEMHTARISELCIIGMIQIAYYSRHYDSLEENLSSLTDVTHMTRLKSGQNIVF